MSPDLYYSEDQDFTLYGYHAVSNGMFIEDGVAETVDASGQTLADTELYKQVGFNVIKIADPFWIPTPTWAKSDLKDIMDQAQSLGLKCLLSDPEITRLTQADASLLGGEEFADQEALNAYVKTQIQDIVSHKAFYGIMLDDEPAYTQFTAIGEVYTAIKACAPNAFVGVNLLPYVEDESHYALYSATNTGEAAYQDYLNSYYVAMGKASGHLQYDDYPVRESGQTEAATGESYILNTHLKNAQIVAKFCKEKNLVFDKVFQTCGGGTTGKIWRKPTQTDMYWQMNIGMAMGVKTFSYWTYYPVRNVDVEYYDQTASFVNKAGEKNALYTWMQAIHTEMQKAADVLFYFNWQGMQIIGATSGEAYLSELTKDSFTGISVNATGGAALVTEMLDSEHNQKGYYVTNVTDPTQTENETVVTITFTGSERAVVYVKGEASIIVLENGVYTFTLKAGQGVFVLPY